MKQDAFIEMLHKAVATPNFYNNKFPYNLGYHHGDGRFSFDCWNMIKAILSGWSPNIPVGGYVKPKDLVTGDVDGYTLLKQCHDRSKDFTKIHVAGTYLYLASSPHAGIYIGDMNINGHTVNVIECTKNGTWGYNGVVYTYVNEQGRRFNYKGGKESKMANGKPLAWSEYGLLPYVEYENKPAVAVPDNSGLTDTTFTDYTVRKGDTLSGIAKKYSTTVDAIMKANPKIKNPSVIYVGQVISIPVKSMQVSNPADKNDRVYHTVQRGETLSSIAKKYGTTYVKIALLNGIANPNKIYVGQKLRVR